MMGMMLGQNCCFLRVLKIIFWKLPCDILGLNRDILKYFYKILISCHISVKIHQKNLNFKGISAKWESGYISVYEPKIKKLKALSFLKLLKLKKRKYLYFFDFWLIGRDIAILWFLYFSEKTTVLVKKNSGAPHKRPRWQLWVFISKVMYFESKKTLTYYI